jgi:hemolysin-activating ACP:hemolysin acyltransferase
MTVIGGELFIASRNALYCKYPTANFLVWTEPAISLSQIAFVYDRSGNPLAYVTWAWLSPDVQDRFLSNSLVSLHVSEWNEGENLTIIDFVSSPRCGRAVISHLRKKVFPTAASAVWVRRDSVGQVRKVFRASNRSISPKEMA